jgi:hypothetical protein
MAWGPEAPVYYFGIPEKERRRRVELTPDLCVIDGEHFFIRGVVQLPVHDAPEPFGWTVWCSLSPESFERVQALWREPGREAEPPYFGWLSTVLPVYPDTLNLRTLVHSRAVGLAPLVELEPTDHPLAVEQREGITMARVREIAERLAHQG